MPTFETGSRLFFGNLPYTMTLEEFVDYFSQFGPITNPSLPEDRDPSRDRGRNKGFGFVTYDSPERAQSLLKQLHGKAGPGGRKLAVRLANVEEKR